MKKFLILFVLLPMLTATSFSQDYLSYVVETTRNADIIVEGTVESSEAFKGENEETYTRYNLSCRQILKGTGVQNGTVSIVALGGNINGIETVCSHCTKLSIGEKGLFFLRVDEAGNTLLNGNAGKVHQLNISESRQGIVPSLRAYVPDWNMLLSSIRKVVNGEIITQGDLEPTDYELCYKIDSIKLVDERHISAKVFAKSNVPNLKFGGGEISIKYPTDLLGSYLVQNNSLTATAGSFVSNGSTYSVNTADLSADEFKLTVGSNCGSNLTYAVFGSSYVAIAELVLKVDVSQANELVTGTEITDVKGKYYDTPTSSCKDFRKLCLEGELFVANCSNMEVEIIGEPGSGIGSMAKITGQGFKNSPGKLKIPDANSDIDDGIVLETIGATLLSWSDNLIEVNLSAMSPGIMGSGLWVVDPSGINISCTDEVDISYSLQLGTVNETDENGNSVTVSKHIRRYSTNELQGAITYYLDNTINDNDDLTDQGLSFSKIEMLVKEALCEWEEETGISINYLGGIDPDEHTNSNDELNVIYFTDAATVLSLASGSNHTVAVTKLTIQSQPGCVVEIPGTPALIRYPIAKDSYTAISQETSWYDKNSGQSIGSGKTDMYMMLLHEIGHSLGMDHALDPVQGLNDTRAMYPFFPAGTTKSGIDGGDKAGGMFLAKESRELLQDPNLITTVCKEEFALNDAKFCTLTSVAERDNMIDIFSVTPNICLTNQQVFVENKANSETNFIVLNALGAVVNSFQLESNTSIDIEFQNSGIHFITAMINGQLFTRKIVVQ